jgi:hypothetical protein
VFQKGLTSAETDLTSYNRLSRLTGASLKSTLGPIMCSSDLGQAPAVQQYSSLLRCTKIIPLLYLVVPELQKKILEQLGHARVQTK